MIKKVLFLFIFPTSVNVAWMFGLATLGEALISMQLAAWFFSYTFFSEKDFGKLSAFIYKWYKK